MSEQLNQALEQYVDWASLEYYDKRIKQYVDARCVEDLKIGGDKASTWFTIPATSENLNRLYRVVDEFVTSDTFEERGIVCGANSVVYADHTRDGIKYKLLVNTVSVDEDIREQLSSMGLELDQAVIRLDGVYAALSTLEDSFEAALAEIRDSNQEISAKLESVTDSVDSVTKSVERVTSDLNKVVDSVEDTETRISEVVADLRATEHSIHDQLHSHEQRLNTYDSSFATKGELQVLESKLDGIPTVNLQGYATETYVQEQLANIPTADLTGYATETFVDTKIAELVGSAPTRLNTIDELASALEDHEDALDAVENLVRYKVDRSELARVATTGSYKDLTDAPEIPSITGLASEKYVQDAVDSIDLTDYAKKSDIPDVSKFVTEEDLPAVPTKVSELENDSGYLTEHQSLEGLATEEFVQQQIDAIPDVDLSNYAKKSDLPDTSKFLTEVPSEYITESELDAKGYLTEHQSLEGLATEEFVRQQIDAIPEVDTSELASKADLELKADKTYVDQQLDNVTVDLTGYATEDFVRTEIANAQLGDDGETIIDLSYLATKTDLSNEVATLNRRIDELKVIQYGTF